MPTTSNFGWTTPADTDLVKDGAAAIRTLGNGIDTSLVDLKGGTTGQVLSKNSNTDLDYTWVTPNVGDITEVQAGTGISVASGTGPIPVVTNTVATAYDAKGDLIVGTGADTFAKLTVGTNGHTLVADSSTATGLKWVAPGAGATAWSLLNSGGTALTGATSITVSGLSAKEILVLVQSASSVNASSTFSLRFNSDSGVNYSTFGYTMVMPDPYGTFAQAAVGANYSGYDALVLGAMSSNAGSFTSASCYIDKADQTGWKMVQVTGGSDSNTGSNNRAYSYHGLYEASAAITSVTIISSTGNFDGGTIYVLGAN